VAIPDRSFADILQDIIANVQAIVRAEVRLAKAEISEEARKARPAGLRLVAGAVFGLSAVMFVLLAAVYGLSNVVPNWAAALIVGLGSGAIGALSARMGVTHVQRIDPTPDKTIRSVKENVAWSKQQLK
jgi:hypothetical protein